MTEKREPLSPTRDRCSCTSFTYRGAIVAGSSNGCSVHNPRPKQTSLLRGEEVTRPQRVEVKTLGHTSSFNFAVVADGVHIKSFDTRFFAILYAKRIKRKGIPLVGRVVFDV